MGTPFCLRRWFLLVDWAMPGDRRAKNRDKRAHPSLAGDEPSSEEMAMDPNITMVLAEVLRLHRYLEARVTTGRDNGMGQPCPSNF
jgi:hypothetical protein